MKSMKSFVVMMMFCLASAVPMAFGQGPRCNGTGQGQGRGMCQKQGNSQKCTGKCQKQCPNCAKANPQQQAPEKK
jgi:hypothetical protein